MQAFTWNSGGSYNGKSWSPEAPTDSALVLFLFAAFLAAPHWDFPKVRHTHARMHARTHTALHWLHYSSRLYKSTCGLC